MAIKVQGATLSINGEPVNTGLTRFQDAALEAMTRGIGVSEKLLGNRRESTLGKTLNARFEMEMVSDPAAWAKFVEEGRRRDAARRRAEIRDVLRALVPAEELSDGYLDHITEHHFIVLPRRVVDEHPALRSFDFVRAHDMPDERVYVVDGKPCAALQGFGTPAKYPHKVRED